MLRGKTIYCIVTGAHRTTTVAVFLNMLKEAHARDIILMPTAAAEPLLDAQTIPDDVIIRRTSNGNMQIPEEDIVVVAPCTFNTFSKIATGIADNYPMSIIVRQSLVLGRKLSGRNMFMKTVNSLRLRWHRGQRFSIQSAIDIKPCVILIVEMVTMTNVEL